MSRRGSTDSTRYERIEERNGYKFLRLKSGRLISFWDAHSAIESAHTTLGTAISRAFKLASDDYDLERLEWLVDTLDSHIGAIRKEIERRRGVRTQEERIKQLRNTAGRTPEEATAFIRKANELERQLRKEASNG